MLTLTEEKPSANERGREAVKCGLIDAACEMLADVGPNAMSVRAVANKAGVNHGQVHHYFGGKQGLIDAAASHLAKEHYRKAKERAAADPIPPALTLARDSQYLRSLVRLVLDGYLTTATRGISEGHSISIDVNRHLTRHYPAGAVPPEIKARFALTSAMEMGWAALEPILLIQAEVSEEEADEVREQARILSRRFIEEIQVLSQNISEAN